MSSAATFPLKQSKFSNGMISEMLWGDSTHPKYGSSLKLCRNWIPVPQGALVKRSGTQFIAPFRDQTYAARLIPFVFSDGQAFVLEIGNLYVRFYKNKQYVGTDFALHTYPDVTPYHEVVTPFTTAMLPYLKYTQVGDVVTLCYGGQVPGVGAVAPRDLRKTTGTVGPWSMTATPIKIPAGVVNWIGSPQAVPSAWSAVVTYDIGDRVRQTNVDWVSIQSTNLNNAPPALVVNSTGTSIAGNLYWMPVVDQSHQGATYNWVYTHVVQDSNGVTYESAPTTVPLVYATAIDTSRPVKIFIAGGTATVDITYTLLYRKLYRATKGGIFGWVLDFVGTVAADTNIVDDGRAADFTKQPPAGTDPWLVNGVDSYPSVVGHFDQRRLWGGSLAVPSGAQVSRAGDLYNYDSRNTPGADTDSLNVLLASEVLEQFRSFVCLSRGLIFTGQGEWVLSGLQGGPISRSSVDPKRQSTWGSSWLNPLRIGTGVIFNTSLSNLVRDFYPLNGIYKDIWDGQDLSVMARDLLDFFTLTDWCFQSLPYPLVWAVRSDGALLSMTYQHAPPSFGQQLAEGATAWAYHTTGAGSDAFESVCSVPEPPEDAVYVGVKRQVTGGAVRHIERFTPLKCPESPAARGVSDARYGKYADSTVTYDGHRLNVAGLISLGSCDIDSILVPGSISTADYGIGAQILINSDDQIFLPGVDDDPTYGSLVIFDPENTLGLGSFKAKVISCPDPQFLTAELQSALTQDQINQWAAFFAFPRAGQLNWAIARSQITVTHLPGYQLDSNTPEGARGIIALADGDVQVPVLFSAGTVYLESPATVVQIGIAYNADAKLLDAYSPNAEIRNRFKNLLRVGFEVSGTRDMWLGKDFDNLIQWVQRDVADAYGVMPLATGYFEEFVTGDGGNKTGQAVVRHYQPLPAIVASILREMDLEP